MATTGQVTTMPTSSIVFALEDWQPEAGSPLSAQMLPFHGTITEVRVGWKLPSSFGPALNQNVDFQLKFLANPVSHKGLRAVCR